LRPAYRSIDALKFHVWRLTDIRYREAVRDFLRKKSIHITYLDPNNDLPSFRRRKPHTDLSYRAPKPVSVDYWKSFVVSSSKVAKAYPEVKNSWVDVRVRDYTRIFVE